MTLLTNQLYRDLSADSRYVRTTSNVYEENKPFYTSFSLKESGELDFIGDPYSSRSADYIYNRLSTIYSKSTLNYIAKKISKLILKGREDNDSVKYHSYYFFDDFLLLIEDHQEGNLKVCIFPLFCKIHRWIVEAVVNSPALRALEKNVIQYDASIYSYLSSAYRTGELLGKVFKQENVFLGEQYGIFLDNAFYLDLKILTHILQPRKPFTFNKLINNSNFYYLIFGYGYYFDYPLSMLEG